MSKRKHLNKQQSLSQLDSNTNILTPSKQQWQTLGATIQDIAPIIEAFSQQPSSFWDEPPLPTNNNMNNIKPLSTIHSNISVNNLVKQPSYERSTITSMNILSPTSDNDTTDNESLRESKSQEYSFMDLNNLKHMLNESNPTKLKPATTKAEQDKYGYDNVVNALNAIQNFFDSDMFQKQFPDIQSTRSRKYSNTHNNIINGDSKNDTYVNKLRANSTYDKQSKLKMKKMHASKTSTDESYTYQIKGFMKSISEIENESTHVTTDDSQYESTSEDSEAKMEFMTTSDGRAFEAITDIKKRVNTVKQVNGNTIINGSDQRVNGVDKNIDYGNNNDNRNKNIEVHICCVYICSNESYILNLIHIKGQKRQP